MDILKGAYDLHIHTAPDSVPRRCTDEEAAQRMRDAGMAGCVLKHHHADTAERAARIRALFPDLDVAGAIVLNRWTGGLNPDAVERCARAGGQFVWFPTMDSRSWVLGHGFNGSPEELKAMLTACDEDNNLLPEARAVLEVANRWDMVVGTGHLDPREGMEVVRACGELGCRCVLTHADNPGDAYTDAQQREAVKLGAMVEHSLYTTHYGYTPIREVARQIRVVGAEHVILTTDFGQMRSPFFDEGLARYAQLLAREGITEEELGRMLRDNPRQLMHKRQTR